MSNIEFTNVTKEEVNIIRGFLTRSGFSGFEGNRGIIQGGQMELDFDWDSESGLLRLDVKKYPSGLQTASEEAARATFESVVHAALGRDGVELQACAVYNRIWVTIKNQSGQELKFSKADPAHGDVEETKNVPKDDETVALFARSSKGSGLGAEGRVIYTLDPGPQLIIDYWLNTASSHNFRVGLEGRNSSYYEYKVENTDARYCASGVYAYMEPKITLKKK